MSLQNVWHLRSVAEASSKACFICYKPTAAVLITPDQKDFFYVCRGHLKDKGFCSPIIDEQEATAKRKKADLDREIEVIKREYEEKLEKKKAKQKDKAEEKVTDEERKKDEKERDDRIKAATEKQGDETSPANAVPMNDTPRIYALHRNIYQMRLDRIRNADLARRNKERLNNPSSFPTVPSVDPA